MRNGSLCHFIDLPALLIVFAGGIFLVLATYRPIKIWQVIKDFWVYEQEKISEEERRKLLEGAGMLKRIETISIFLGFVGMLIGISQLLAHPDDPSSVGPAMAIALLCALYSIILSKLLCQSVRLKLLQKANRLEEAPKISAAIDWRLLLFIVLSLFLFIPFPG